MVSSSRGGATEHAGRLRALSQVERSLSIIILRFLFLFQL
jgi:formate hydrogenlyase subunit 4